MTVEANEAENWALLVGESETRPLGLKALA